MGAGGWRRGRRASVKWDGSSIWEDGEAWEWLVVMVTQQCERVSATKRYVYVVKVNFMRDL